MDENCGIYKIKIGNFIYIGSSKDLIKRKRDHLNKFKSNSHYNSKLQSAYNKYQNFEFEVIELCIPEERLNYEQKWIDSIWENKNCANLRKKAESPLGMKRSQESIDKSVKSRAGYSHSEETRKKISSSNMGRIIPEETKNKISLTIKAQMSCPERREINRKSQLGKTMSEETKGKIKKSLTGRKRTKKECENISRGNLGKTILQETREKISKTLTGRKRSEEAIRKTSLAKKGKPLSQKNKDALSLSKTKNSIVLIFETGEETFFSLKHASEKINVKIHTLNAWLDGKNAWPQKQSLHNPCINGLIGGYKIKKIDKTHDCQKN